MAEVPHLEWMQVQITKFATTVSRPQQTNRLSEVQMLAGCIKPVWSVN